MRWLVPVLIVLAGCNNCNKSQETADTGAPAPAPTSAPADATTDAARVRHVPKNGAAAMTALSADVDKRLAAPPPAGSAERLELIDELLQRADVMGKASDLVRADELTAGWHDEHFARAKVLAATMRYEEATAELDRATSTPRDQSNALRWSILIDHGEYDEAAQLQPAKIENVDAITMARAGFLARRMQKKEEGQRLVNLALDKAGDDPSPIPYAWICFHEAMLYAYQGDDVSAESWFGSALNVIPQYAHAEVHLAPSQQPDRALAMLTEIAKTSDDPEVLVARAGTLDRLGKKDEAKKAVADAAKAYDGLLAKLPTAFADHAARFYLGLGNDPTKALELARANAKRRPTEETTDLWMAAAAGAKNDAEACTAAKAMKELKYTSARARALANAKCPALGPH